MSYSDDRYAEAQREWELRESRKINIALWPDQMQPFGSGSNLPPACELCSIQLVMKDNGWFCKGCGNITPISTSPPVQKPKKFKPKQSGTGSPSLIIASQNRSGKKRKPKSLDGLSSNDSGIELRKDLQALGVIASDINEY